MLCKKRLSLFSLLLPLLLLMTGCFQWGIGDPDQSQIEKKLVGVWYAEHANYTTVVHLRPFDKRTYIIDYMTLNGSLEQAEIDSRLLVKAWHVKANNVLFLVTEWLGPYENEKAKNVRFTINQLDVTNENLVRIRHVKHNYPALKAAKTEAEFEKVIRENALDDEMYEDWQEFKRVAYQRVQKLYHPNR